MSEQAAGAAQITSAAESMRVQAEQAAKATAEHSKAIADINTASNNVAKQIKVITRANREQAATAGEFLNRLGDIRGITERNATGAKETLHRTSGLLQNARRLTEMAETLATTRTPTRPAGREVSNGPRRTVKRASRSPAKRRR